MVWFVLIPVILWLIVMTFLLIPSSFYSSTFDRITKAKWRKDRISLQIMLDHLINFPDDWSINRDSVSYPKEGAKQIMLNHDGNNGWQYSLISFDGKFRNLDGHFEKNFNNVILKECSNRESRALLRNFYPNLEGQLLLK